MIIRSVCSSYTQPQESFDFFIYGLGFETRSTFLARQVKSAIYLALQMPEMPIHDYAVNLRFAKALSHQIVQANECEITSYLTKIIDRDRTRPLSIGFDLSSLNRFAMFSVLSTLSRICMISDRLLIFYVPAAYADPDRSFPQIEGMGPMSLELSGFDNDATKPICLLLGVGFEAGLSLGVINHLEPRISICFWGTGLDSRYDKAVHRANFDFDYTGFDTMSRPYLVTDPKGTFLFMESMIYGLVDRYNLIVAPLGPKVFSFVTYMLSLKHFGKISVWRVQQRRQSPPNALPGDQVVVSTIDMSSFLLMAIRREEMLAN